MFFNFLLQLIVLFLPTQLGWHFWPDFSRVAGIKIDYLSPTLYFTDILLFFYLFINTHQILKWFKKNLVTILVFLSFVAINTYFSVSPINALFWWLRFTFYLLFYLSLRLRNVTWSKVRLPLLISSTLVILLQVLQQLHQGSIGGLFYWLGERSYSATSSGLAKISLFGLDYVRSPSLFSHPNSFAGYLLVILFLSNIYKSPRWQKILILFSLSLSFSKGALLALFLVNLFGSYPLFLITFSLIFSFLEPFLPVILNTFRFISDRQFFMATVKQLIASHFYLGVGLGGFIPYLANNLPGSFLSPAKLQPVHNLFLLMFSELGLLGFGLISCIVYKIRHLLANQPFLILLSLVFITGTFDHYWWTLPQNRLILLLSAALLL